MSYYKHKKNNKFTFGRGGVDMPGLDWFTEEAQSRAKEIYDSFHPKAKKDEYPKKIKEDRKKAVAKQ